MNILEKITSAQVNPNVPEFRVGDTVKIGYKVVEGKRERVQFFEGIVIARKGCGSTETFTLRAVVSGVGVQRTFPVNSPRIDSFEVIKKGKVRRAKLYFLRDREKQYKIKERNR